MNVNVEETGPVERRLTIEIPTTEVDAAFDSFFREVRRNAHIRGFRPGKAPREVLEQQFGERASGEVLQRLVESTLFQAIQDAQLDVLGEPRLDAGELPKPGAQYAYKASVDVRPEIEVAAVEGTRVEARGAAHAREGPGRGAPRGHAAAPGAARRSRERHRGRDAGYVAVINYVGKLDGEPFEGSSAKESQVELGAGRTFAGFEDQLLGLARGRRARLRPGHARGPLGREAARRRACASR